MAPPLPLSHQTHGNSCGLCLGLIIITLPPRWGNIPLDDAVQFNHLEVVKLLQDYQDSYVLSETQAEAEAEALSKENLESMV